MVVHLLLLKCSMNRTDQSLSKTSKDGKKRYSFCQSGENLANLVTLELTQIVNCGCSSPSTKVLHGMGDQCWT